MKLKIAIIALVAALVMSTVPLFQSMPALAADNVTVDATSNVSVDVDITLEVPPPPPPADPPAPPCPPPPAPPAPPPPPPGPSCEPDCCDCHAPSCKCSPVCCATCPPCPPSWNCYTYIPSRVVVVPKVIIASPPKPIVCAPTISSFTANPSCVQRCEEVTLSWNVNNADTVTLSPGVGSVPSCGSHTISLCSTTTYVLTASNGTGSVSASTTVTVVPTLSASYSIGSEVSSADVSEDAGIAAADTGSFLTSWLKSDNGWNNSWLFILLILLLAAGTAAAVIFIRKPALAHAGGRSSTEVGYLPWSSPTMERTETAKTTSATAVGTAKFVSADGEQIPIAVNGTMGRDSFRLLVPSGKTNLISREHLRISCENGAYYIEDLNSTNGSKLNGESIRGKGKTSLSDGDVVSLADVLTLTFKA